MKSSQEKVMMITLYYRIRVFDLTWYHLQSKMDIVYPGIFNCRHLKKYTIYAIFK